MIQTNELDCRIADEASIRWQQLSLHLINRLPFGVVLTDRDGRVLHMNSRAGTLIEAQDGLRLLDGRIAAVSSGADARMRRAIASVLDSNGAATAPEQYVLVPVPCTHRAIQVFVTLALRGPQRTGDCRSAVLLLYAPSRLSMAATVLMDLYGLTPAEAHVARGLVAGERPASIGAATGTSLNTVRTHIKKIFTKSGCRTQAEFVHSVLTGPAPMLWESA
jgi:DNA-binding CsgD family transcriptional regulator